MNLRLPVFELVRSGLRLFGWNDQVFVANGFVLVCCACGVKNDLCRWYWKAGVGLENDRKEDIVSWDARVMVDSFKMGRYRPEVLGSRMHDTEVCCFNSSSYCLLRALQATDTSSQEQSQSRLTTTSPNAA